MKKIHSIFRTALLAGSIFTLGACSNEENSLPQLSNVPLQVEVAGVQAKGRAIVEGTTLPNESSYGIFAYYGNSSTLAKNVKVNYSNGTSTLTQNVFLPENNDVSVYAYYPYMTDMAAEKYQIQSASQIDYLYGYSADSDNKLGYVNEAQPKASIYFRHAMARVTLKVKKAADNENSYKLPYVSLMNVKKNGYLYIKESAVIDCSGTEELIAKPDNYVLEAVDDEIVVDFLVLPMNTAEQPVTLGLGSNATNWDLTANIPNVTWVSGQQYTYTVTVSKGELLDISNAVIFPWDVSEKDGLNIDNDNYAGEAVTAEAIDLGLSVKWASCNVGAHVPEEIGNYYAWGELEEKETYTYDNYTQIEYLTLSEFDANISGTQYDVARQKWGSVWRMPTKQEFEELVDDCIWEETTLNGVKGYLIYGNYPLDTSIFIPNTGYKSSSQTVDSHEPCYWTSTCNMTWKDELKISFSWACFEYDGKYGAYITASQQMNIINGLAIRPVMDK